VELAGPKTGSVAIGVEGTILRDTREPKLQLPRVSPEQAAVERGQIAVFFDKDLKAEMIESGGARSIAPAALADSLKAQAQVQASYALEYDTAPSAIAFALQAQSPRVDARVATTVSVREGSLAYLSVIEFEIEQASRGQFQFTTPDWLGDDIDVRGLAIREKRSEPGPAGRRTWTVWLQQPVRGSYRLTLVQIVPVPADGAVRAPFVVPLEAELMASVVILENRSATELSETAAHGVTSVPPDAEMPVKLAESLRRRAVSIHRVNDPAGSLEWQRRERPREKGLAASVTLADLLTVIDRDGNYRTQAAYVISNRTQQFLEVSMPAGSTIWGVYVGGQPARPATVMRGGKTVTLLPLHQMSASNFGAQVVLVYSGSLGGKLSRWTKVEPPAPQIAADVPVARTIWTVYVPDEFSVTMKVEPSNMTQVESGDLVIARGLAFFEEANEVLNAAKLSTSENTQTLACNNLKQISGALGAFQNRVTNEPPPSMALSGNVQTWRVSPADYNVNRFRAENTTTISKQLQQFFCPSNRGDGVVQLGKVRGTESWSEVQRQAQNLQSQIAKLDMNRAEVAAALAEKEAVRADEYFERQSEQSELRGHSLLQDKFLANEQGEVAAKQLEEQDRKAAAPQVDRDAQRGKMRGKAAEQVDKLQALNSATLNEAQARQAEQGEDLSRAGVRFEANAKMPLRTGYFGRGGQTGNMDVRDGVELRAGMAEVAVGERITGMAAGGAGGIEGTWANPQPASGAMQYSDEFRAGNLSLDIRVTPVGQPYSFSKVRGEPKLVLEARHRDLKTWSAGAVWALLCLAIAASFAHAVTRADAVPIIHRAWPWLAAAVGTAWLFLLPAGPLGLALIVAGLGTLAWRSRVKA
jgi:hypothetical protein